MFRIAGLFLPLLACCFSAPGQVKIPLVHIETPMGSIWVQLSHKTPRHTNAFIHLAQSGYFDSLSLNRIVPGFVVQGGCPDTPEGFAGSPHLLAAEFHDSLRHRYGAFGAGRDDNPAMQSAICQFYIVQAQKGVPRLDGKYTIFGQVIAGMDHVNQIAALPRDARDTPLGKPVTIRVRAEKLTTKQCSDRGLPVVSDF